MFRQTARLGFERLECRDNPSTFNVPWADSRSLTLSFVPDGTPTPAGPSTLFAKLNAVAPTATWQNEILRAYQTWLGEADINIAVAADNGQPLGVPGAVQGDGRFGDIRVAAAAIGSETTIAQGSPFSWTGTTFSGELVFNSGRLFQIGGAAAGAHDLYSVALHEAGHSLGLPHNTAADSVMLEDHGVHTTLGTGDGPALRNLYGGRPADAFETGGGNETAAAAKAIPANGASQLLADGDLRTAADVDWYKFNVSLVDALVPVVVRLKATGLSLLNAKVSVFNSQNALVGSAVASNPAANDLAIQFSAPLLGGDYKVKVERAPGSFPVGRYLLTVDHGLLSLLSPVLVPVVNLLDAGTNDLISNATNLTPSDPSGQTQRFDYTFRGSLEWVNDKDFYKVTLPPSPAGSNLYAIAWPVAGSAAKPRLRVYNAAQQLVAATILTNDGAEMSVVIPNVAGGAVYYLQVDSQAGGAVGGYVLGADVNASPPPVPAASAAGTVSPATPRTVAFFLDVQGLRQFSLTAPGLPGGSVTAGVYDAANHLVFTLTLTAGSGTVTAVQTLASGLYTVRVTTATPGATAYSFGSLQLSDDVGTYPSSTSGALPSPRPATGSSSTRTPPFPARPTPQGPQPPATDVYEF